jgi:hypothetical protein
MRNAARKGRAMQVVTSCWLVIGGRNTGTPPDIVDRGKRVVGSGGDDGRGIGIGGRAPCASRFEGRSGRLYSSAPTCNPSKRQQPWARSINLESDQWPGLPERFNLCRQWRRWR